MKNKEKNEIKIIKLKRKYLITNEKYTISVIVDAVNRLSIYRQHYFNKGFDFINSDPEIVENVAKLMLEAVKLVKKKKNEDK